MLKTFFLHLQNKMRKQHLKYYKTITFSRWSRKKYAVLASLGKQIKIGNVRLEICELALQKSDKSDFNNVMDSSKVSEDDYPDDTENLITETCCTQITSNTDSSARLRRHFYSHLYFLLLFHYTLE